MRRFAGTPVLLAAALLLIAAASVAAMPGRAHAAGTAFSTGMLPKAPVAGLPHNEDGEPGMAIDGGGTIWIASDIAPYAADDPRAQTTGVLSGSDVWKSTDHGLSYQWVTAPFQEVPTQAGLGGEDTDIAANPVMNANGCYDIWVASLWVGSTSLAVSQDCGNTWTVIPVQGTFGQDRPWLAAFGQCTVLMSYHALTGYDTVVDEFSLPPCTGQGTGLTVPPTLVASFVGNGIPGLSNRFGKLVVDNSPTSPYKGNIYQPEMGCDANTTSPQQNSVGCTTSAKVFMGVGTLGTNSLIWNDSTVHDTGSTNVYIWPDTAAVDGNGTVYIAWMEGPQGYAQHLYLSRSINGGQTWSSPRLINQGPSLSGAYATVAAGAPGRVDVAWYGTTRDGGTADPAVMGIPNTTLTAACGNAAQHQPACTPASWRVWWATSNDYGATFSPEQPITDTIHTGVLCTSGGGCGTYTGDRNLLDDFGVMIDPVTSAAVMTFTNDQPGGLAGTSHTDYATQTVGPVTNTPDLLSPGLALMGGAAMVAAAYARRRRRSRGMPGD